MEKIISFLKSKNKSISSMESCTGGLFASELTNVDGASNVFKLGLVTYSNEYKTYFGVTQDIINKYTVYSTQVAEEMAKSISILAKSDLGVGITGQLGTKDLNNNSDNINSVYISIYLKKEDKYYTYEIESQGNNKYQSKCFIINFVKEKLHEICK